MPIVRGRLFGPILDLRCFARLPLHVARIVRAPMLQGAHMINDPAVTGTVGLARSEAGMQLAKCLFSVRATRNLAVTIARDADRGAMAAGMMRATVRAVGMTGA